MLVGPAAVSYTAAGFQCETPDGHFVYTSTTPAPAPARPDFGLRSIKVARQQSQSSGEPRRLFTLQCCLLMLSAPVTHPPYPSRLLAGGFVHDSEASPGIACCP